MRSVEHICSVNCRSNQSEPTGKFAYRVVKLTGRAVNEVWRTDAARSQSELWVRPFIKSLSAFRSAVWLIHPGQLSKLDL